MHVQRRFKDVVDRPGPVALALGAVVLGFAVLMPLAARPLDTQAYYLAFILLLLTLLPLVVGIATGTLDIFEPIIPISLLIGLAFGIRAMYLVYDETTYFAVQVARVSFDDFIIPALMLAIAGYGALLLGYYVLAGRVWSRRRGASGGVRPAPPGASLTKAKVITLAGVALFATAARVGYGDVTSSEVTSGTFALALLSTFAQYTACILALHIAAGDNRRWVRLVLWFGIVPLAALQALAFSSKAPILLALYAMMAARHYAKRRLRLHFLAIGVMVSVLVVFPTVNVFRDDPGRPLTVGFTAPTLDELVSKVANIPSFFSGMTMGEYARFAMQSVVGRANGIDSLALVMKYGATTDLGNPSAYWQIPLYAFIPRAIWPDKPVILTGVEFARLFVTPADEELTKYPSIGIFHFGDLYASFGPSGLLVGMCLLGCLYRLMYRVFDPARTPDLALKFVYIMTLWIVVNGFESDIPTIYGNLLKTLVVLLAIRTWLNWDSRASLAPRRAALSRNAMDGRQRPRAPLSARGARR